MDQLFKVINFDTDILKIMCAINPLPHQWSSPFLNQCSLLINKIKDAHYSIIKCHYTKKTIQNENIDVNYLFNLAKKIFLNTKTFIKQINENLSNQETDIMTLMFQNSIVETPEEFHYMMGHLPFYRNVVSLL